MSELKQVSMDFFNYIDLRSQEAPRFYFRVAIGSVSWKDNLNKKEEVGSVSGTGAGLR